LTATTGESELAGLAGGMTLIIWHGRARKSRRQTMRPPVDWLAGFLGGP
jgi:hypothetical protein